MTLSGEIYSFEEAPLYQKSAQTYIETGIDIFDLKNKEAIPNVSTSSFPHAHSIVKLLKQIKTSKKKLRVLECGAGNGIFARHFLFACKKEGLLDKVEYLISDFDFRIVKDLRSRSLYQEFKENVHFRYLKLDLMNLDECIDIKSKPFDLGEIDLVIMNYCLHALPCSIYKKDNELLEKLYIEFLEQDNHQVQVLKEFWMEEKKVRFEAKEKKYLDLLHNIAENYKQEQKIHFNFNALDALEQLLNRLSPNGFIYIADIPTMDFDSRVSYRAFAGAIAYILNSQLISNFVETNKYWNYIHNDFILYKHIISKSQPSFRFKQTLKENFENNNPCVLFCEMISAMKIFVSNQSYKAYKALLNEFLRIDDVSVYSKLYQAIYYMKIKKFKKSKKLFEEAEKVNFFTTCPVHQYQKKLELLMERESLLKSMKPKFFGLFEIN